MTNNTSIDSKDQLYCDKCLEIMTPLGNPDDIGNITYQCANGHQTTHPINKQQKEESEALRKRLAEETKPENIKKVTDAAKRRVRARIQMEEYENGKKLSQADKLMIFFEESGALLFIDQHSTPYVRIKTSCETCDIYDVLPSLSVEHTLKIKGIGVDSEAKVTQISQTPQYKFLNYPIDSTFFKNWISNLFYEQEEKVPANESLSSAKNVLKGKAQQEGKKYMLYNRVAPDPSGDGSIWLDMADANWRAIHITKNGWTIENESPILFRRYVHQLPLVEPKSNGDAWQILNLTNIDQTDDQSKLAFICAVISYFIPLIAHPIITVSGPQGSAKSWLLALIRRLIDPSSIDLLSLPETPRELAQQLYHHWLAPFDNITWFEKWVSDMLCKAVTGAGISVRKLYTDDEDIILSFKHCLMLNGVNVAAQEADLLDRCLLILLKEIPSECKKTEKELNEIIQEVLPYILGGCLDVLSKALTLYPTIEIKEHQRLADFNVYGCAIAIALGKTKEDFLEAYKTKVTKQNEEALNADDVALAFLEFCNKEVRGHNIGENKSFKEDSWINTPSELANKLGYYASVLGIDTGARSWPKSTNSMTRRLNQIVPALKSIGIVIVNYDGTPRQIEINAKKYGTKKPTIPPLLSSILTQERIEATYSQIKKIAQESNSPVAKAEIADQDALKALLRDGRVYDSNLTGYVGVA